MPVSPDLAASLAKEVLAMYTEAEEILLAKVARRLRRGLDDDSWAEQKLIEVQSLRAEARREVERLTGSAPAAIDDAVKKAYNRGSATAAGDLEEIGTPVQVAFTATDELAVARFAEEAVESVTATHRRILRSVDDIYRSVIAETASQVTVGAATRREAAQSALDRFAMRGVTGFIDAGGRAWDLASYAEMATRAATGNAAVSGHLDRLQSLGHDTVIVSDAPGECRLCRPWEGQILSISGRTSGQRLADGRSVVDTVDGARAAGLFHPGCRHSTGIYIPGFTRPLTRTADPAGDVARQEQRRLERGVRAWKRRQSVAMSPEVERATAAKVSEWRGKLKTHVDKTGGKRLRYRETIGAR